MDTNFAGKIRHIRDPKARMAVVWSHCKAKMVCEADEPKEENAEEGEEPKKGHGGCGHVQPLIRKEGLKMFVQYKRTKDEDDVGIIAVFSLESSHSYHYGCLAHHLAGIEVYAA